MQERASAWYLDSTNFSESPVPRKPKFYQVALDWIFAHLLASVLAYFLRAYCLLLRWEVRGLDHLKPYWGGKQPVIVGCWHGRLLMLPEVWRRHGAGKTYVLMGLNRNGELITRIVSRFRMLAVRGGSSKGGEAAREAMVACVKADAHTTLSLTPDGPRGPRYVSRPGMAYLSRNLNIPVVWVSASAKSALRFTTWDRFMLPLPFSRVVVEFHTPILPADQAALSFENYKDALDDKGREYLRQLDDELGVLTGEDDKRLGELVRS